MTDEKPPGVSQRERANALLVHKVLSDRMKEARIGTAADFLDGAEAGDRSTAKLADGSVLGAVSVANGRKTAQVVDTEKLTAWVSEHCPTEVEVVYETRVRQAFLTVLLGAVRDHGGWLDNATGEIQPVDGVEMKQGDDYLIVKPADDADELLEQAWRRGDVDIRAALQIEGPK